MRTNVEFPAGLRAIGTDRQSEGFWRDGDKVRFYEGSIQPIGGWARLSQTPVAGKGREITTWAAVDNSIWSAIGTDQGLFVMTKGGNVSDITPDTFTAGQPIATFGGGYGTAGYGAGAYGLPTPSDTSVIEATVWSLANFGEDLIGTRGENTDIYRWSPSDTSVKAAKLPNSPTANAVVVTEENIVMALGADGDPRLLKWSDIRDAEDWTPTDTNRAGDLRVPTQGRLSAAVIVQGGALLFTEADVWFANYLGFTGYGVQVIADGAGAISKNAMVKLDGQVVWMGQEGFWSYAGQPFSIKCDIADDIFSDLNRAQLSLVTAFHNSAFGEVWWFYPSKDSSENNRYASYSYREGHWSKGQICRLSCTDMAPFDNPLMVGDDGHIYLHEIGTNHEGSAAYLIGGPLSLGETVATITAYIPDSRSLGDTRLSITSRYYPHGDELFNGPYVTAMKTDMRVTGREVDFRFDMTPDEDWRIGKPMIEIRPRGRR